VSLKQKDKALFMSDQHANDPLHGQTLEMIVNSLVSRYGWSELGTRIDIRCFKNDPSVKSSLKFLRKTPWARKKVEDLFIAMPKKNPGIGAG
jgi:uncharacterized protein (DUF2132 family)